MHSPAWTVPPDSGPATLAADLDDVYVMTTFLAAR